MTMRTLAVILALLLATGAVSTPTPTLAQCESDTVLQQQVAEFNKLSARCEAAAIKEENYVMRLWHWKGCMWDFHAPNFTGDQIQTGISKLGLHLHEPQL